jgi:hypothetical protein
MFADRVELSPKNKIEFERFTLTLLACLCFTAPLKIPSLPRTS